LPDDHGHSHISDHHNSGDSSAVIEEPLDPASQSLADALRSSFRVLKFFMFLIVIVYCFSGFGIVDQKEVVVLTWFGKQVGPPREPGLLIAAPYPFH